MTGPVIPDRFDWEELDIPEQARTAMRTLGQTSRTWGLEKYLDVWHQWVKELVIGALWVRWDLESAITARTGPSKRLRELGTEPGADTVRAYVGELDALFERWTEEVHPPTDEGWWTGREPVRPVQRAYLRVED